MHNKSSERRKWNQIYVLERFSNDLESRPCKEKRLTNEVELSTIHFEVIENSALMDINPFNSGTCLVFNTQKRIIRNCNFLIQHCRNNTFTNETVFMMQYRKDNSKNITGVWEPLSM